MKKREYKFLRISLFIIFPLFLGLAPRGCAFLELLFYYNCIQSYTLEGDINASGEWSLANHQTEIYVGDDGVIYIPEDLCSFEYFQTIVTGNPDLFAVTQYYKNSIGSIAVGEGGTIVQIDPNSQINFISNPAGPYNLNAINRHLPFESNVLAVGDSGTVIKSSDDGLTWAVVNFPFTANLYDVQFSGDEIIVTGQGTYKTTNGGANWQVIGIGDDFNFPGPTVFYDMFFVDDNVGYVGGDFGLMGKTTDGGENWTTLFVPGVTSIKTMYFMSPDSGVIAGDNGVIRFTSDGGLIWQEDPDVTALIAGRSINTIYVSENNYGILMGDDSLHIVFSTDSTLLSADDEEIENPSEYNLSYNYPNPFNPTTKIQYHIPNVGLVQIKVYDILGNEVATLVNEEKPAGEYEVEFNAYGLSSGVYFYRLTTGEFAETKKLILLR